MVSKAFSVTSVLAILISAGVYRFRSFYFPSIECNSDPPISFGSNISWNACNVFSLEYESARSKFRNAVRQLEDRVDIEKFALDVVDGDDSMTIDIAVIKGTRDGVVVHSSGTHGVEGYAGSAIQISFLQLLQEDPIVDRPTVVLVHSVNPYGMKHYRRVNENNVDLNRNAIADFDKFLKERHPNIANYDSYRDFISPERAPSAWEVTLGWWISGIHKLIVHGFASLKQVLVAGQYHHPTGFSYGGAERQPSIEILTKFMQEHGFLEGKVVWIDVHTGLGKFGKDTLLLEETTETEDSLQHIFPTAEHIVTPNVEDKKAMGGYDLTRGMVLAFLQEKNPSGLYLLQEFGTLPPIFVGRSLILENMVYHYGTNKTVGRQFLQPSFYPQSSEWRASIVTRGVALLLQSIDYSNSLNRSS
eukprot:scaffold17468_cov106-Cylindrotheca_fusiformis.AAC.3